MESMGTCVSTVCEIQGRVKHAVYALADKTINPKFYFYFIRVIRGFSAGARFARENEVNC